MIIQGNALDELKKLDNESIDCCITSPPYYHLRDYGVKEQIGLERTLEEYIDKLSDVFIEVKRVLKKTGTCWIVIGDTYSQSRIRIRHQFSNKANFIINNMPRDRANKSLLMIPSRLAIRMIDSGWVLRNDIIWQKPNCMPSSAKDRFTVDYEHIFFFVKSDKYYFKPSDTKRTVWKFNVSSSQHHNAVFPKELVKQFVYTGCPENGIVLDPFLGSGTTYNICQELNRKCIGIEINPQYVEITKTQTNPSIPYNKLDYFQ